MSSEARALAEQIISLIAVNPLGHYERDETDWDTHALSTEDFIAKMTPLIAAALQDERAKEREACAKAVTDLMGKASANWNRAIIYAAEACRARAKGEV